MVTEVGQVTAVGVKIPCDEEVLGDTEGRTGIQSSWIYPKVCYPSSVVIKKQNKTKQENNNNKITKKLIDVM